MDKSEKNVKIFGFGRRIRRIKNLEADIERLEAEMDELAKFEGVIFTQDGKPADPFSKFCLEIKAARMDILYEQIEAIRKEIDELEENVIEIRIRF